MQAARELIRGLAWWLGVAPMALLVGTRLCYPLRHRRSWAPAEYLINLPPLLASVMVVVAAQQLEHLCFLLDDLFELLLGSSLKAEQDSCAQTRSSQA